MTQNTMVRDQAEAEIVRLTLGRDTLSIVHRTWIFGETPEGTFDVRCTCGWDSPACGEARVVEVAEAHRAVHVEVSRIRAVVRSHR